jgi:hypothetical protein
MHSTYNYCGFVDIYANLSRQSKESSGAAELRHVARPAPRQSRGKTTHSDDKARRQHLKLIRG